MLLHDPLRPFTLSSAHLLERVSATKGRAPDMISPILCRSDLHRLAEWSSDVALF
jgi:hypothetical protein